MSGKIIFTTLVITAAFTLQLSGQQADTASEKTYRPDPYHWNVLKLNVTPMLMWSSPRNITISYERLVKRSQSFAVQAGFLEMPQLFHDSIAGLINLQDHRTKAGINLAFDYRFYLSKRNTRPAPDGIYLGPYASYYRYRFQNDFAIMNTSIVENGAIKGGFDIINLGLSLGYQFVFWKRFTIDLLLFGPSMSIYSANLEIEGNLSQEMIDKIDKEVLEKLLARFPIIGYLVKNDNSFSTGYRMSFGLGFRYSIQFGFHF